MAVTTLARSDSLTVTDYRCDAGPDDAPYVECHAGFDVACVRAGTFGRRTRGTPAAPPRPASRALW